MEQETPTSPAYSDQSPEERKQYNAEKQKKSRNRRKLREAAATAATSAEFWQKMRRSANAAESLQIKLWEQQQEDVLDQLNWMNNGWKIAPDDPAHVDFQTGVLDLDDFIAERGLIHDFEYQSPFLQDFRPQWAVWASKSEINDPIWGTVAGFWTDAKRFNALCEESEPTAIYVTFGLRVALPAYHVRMFKQSASNHTMFGNRKTHLEYDTDCYLCKFEKAHGIQVPPAIDGGTF